MKISLLLFLIMSASICCSAESSAVAKFQELANQGDAEAQFFVGLAYQGGIEVEKDVSTAVKWFQKAAAQGYPDAQCSLGFCCLLGEGVERDEYSAIMWFRKASEAGSPHAKEVLESKGETVTLIQQAEQGNVESQYFLAAFCFNGTANQSVCGDITLSKNLDAAVKWAKRASENGSDDAMVLLATMYLTGEGVEENKVVAVQLMDKAYHLGNDQAIKFFKDFEDGNSFIAVRGKAALGDPMAIEIVRMIKSHKMKINPVCGADPQGKCSAQDAEK